MKPVEIRDILNYTFLSDVKYAPDGKRAAFVVSRCNEEENSYESRLWLYDGAFRQLTDLGKEARYFWEDANTILFPAVRSASEKKRAEKDDALLCRVVRAILRFLSTAHKYVVGGIP